MARLTRFKRAAKPEIRPFASVNILLQRGSFQRFDQIIAMPPFTCSVWPVM
jgi:hypothetical protein